MRKGISVIIGEAERADGSCIPVYRALQTLLCSLCLSTIEEGTLFTRRALADTGLRIAAQCRECAPFTTRDDGGRGQCCSPLMESLLAPVPEGRAEARPRETGRVDEEVVKRLGPALRYRSGKRRTDR